MRFSSANGDRSAAAVATCWRVWLVLTKLIRHAAGEESVVACAAEPL